MRFWYLPKTTMIVDDEASAEDLALEDRMAAWRLAMKERYEATAKAQFRRPRRLVTEEPVVEDDDASTFMKAEEDKKICDFYKEMTKRIMQNYNVAEEEAVPISEEEEEKVPDGTDPLWVRRLRTGRKRLIVLAPADPGRSLGTTWTMDAEVLMIVPPGRGHRAHETVESLEDIAKKVPSDVLDSESVIFGHGIGALLAYEIVRWRRTQNKPLPKHLVVSGCRPPHHLNDFIIPQEQTGKRHVTFSGWNDDVALLSYVTRLRAGDEPLLLEEDDEEEVEFESVKDRKQREARDAKQRAQRIRRAQLATLAPELQESSGLRRTVAEAIREDYRLLERHRHAPDWPLECPITVVAGDEDPVSDALLDEWHTETSRAFHLRRIPGGPHYVHDARGITLLTDLLLRDILEEDSVDDS